MSPKTLIWILVFDVPKWIYNRCPLKHEVRKMPMSNEMIYDVMRRYQSGR